MASLMVQSLTYETLEKVSVPKPVDRISWIAQNVSGRNVLDLGAFDETALHKRDTPFWLHAQIAKQANTVIGIDNSANLPEGGVQTSPKSWIYRGDIFNLKDWVSQHAIQTVVAGELIEHLPDTLSFLKYLAHEPCLADKDIILTTPNTTSAHNILIGLFGRESQHPDHLQIYSYKTLHTIFQRAGFKHWEILPYHVRFSEMILASKAIKKVLVKSLEHTVNALESCFPLLSGGWIIKARQ